MDANVLFLKYEDMHRVSSQRCCLASGGTLSMVLELSMVPGPTGARTKWRHGLVMQSQMATEGGMGSAQFFHAQGCMWDTEKAWTQVPDPAHGLCLDGLVPRTSSRLAHCGVMWKAKKKT